MPSDEETDIRDISDEEFDIELQGLIIDEDTSRYNKWWISGAFASISLLLVGGWVYQYALVDRTGDGEISVQDLIGAYDVTQHPLVKEGTITPEEVLNTFNNG